MTSTRSKYIYILLLVLLFGCGSHSLEDFRDEGEEISYTLVEELKPIQNREELLKAAPKLKKHFIALVDVMIRAQKYREQHPSSISSEFSLHYPIASEQLRVELNRIYGIEGARAIVERCQEDALHKLDAFEKSKKAQCCSK